MAKPLTHALSSVKRWGGIISDYLGIHHMMDTTKLSIADSRHRAIFHSSFGCGIIENMFGEDLSSLREIKEKYNLSDEVIKDILDWKRGCISSGKEITLSTGRVLPVRAIAEQHCIEDFNGFIPSLQDYLELIEPSLWMNGVGYPPSHPKSFIKE